MHSRIRRYKLVVINYDAYRYLFIFHFEVAILEN